MVKNLFFVIDSLNIGGAEKSLISLLNNIDASKYHIDLMVFKQGGDLEGYIPKFVKILDPPDYYQYLNKKRLTNKKISYLFYKYKTSFDLRLNNISPKKLHTEQIVFKNIHKIITPIQKKYDVAIAYSQGMPTYFVANKITAKKKIAWINTDYVNTLYDKEIDYKSYKQINNIITVSNHLTDSISLIKKDYKEKMETILDIIDPNIIINLSEENFTHNIERSKINILTVGRLVTAKDHSLAIKVAKRLKEHEYNFKWCVIGEGPERENLQKQINAYDLKHNFILLGKKINPYVYFKNCDIYVQTSLKEGFGLSVSEAKILKRPIVCTDFPTASEIIRHNIDGQIVNHNVESVFQGIKKYIENNDFRNKIIYELNSTASHSSLNQINKFYELIEK